MWDFISAIFELEKNEKNFVGKTNLRIGFLKKPTVSSLKLKNLEEIRASKEVTIGVMDDDDVHFL